MEQIKGIFKKISSATKVEKGLVQKDLNGSPIVPTEEPGKSMNMMTAGDDSEWKDFLSEEELHLEFIKGLAYKYYYRVPILDDKSNRHNHVKNQINNIMKVIFRYHEVEMSEQNIHVFLDAILSVKDDSNKEAFEGLWKDFVYTNDDVVRAIEAYKDAPIGYFKVYDHDMYDFSQETTQTISAILNFFNFKPDSPTVDLAVKTFRHWGDRHKHVPLEVLHYKDLMIIVPSASSPRPEIAFGRFVPAWHTTAASGNSRLT
jgi:hypothetical protein